MSPAQALALRDRLGWTSSPTDEEMFTTDHGIGEKDAFFATIKRGQTVASFDLILTSRVPKDVMDEAVPITRRAFDAYVEALTAVYGQGARGKRKQHASVTWVLPSDASVRIGTVSWLISISITSRRAMRRLGVRPCTSMRSPTRTTPPADPSITRTSDHQLCYGLSRAAAF